MKNGQLRDNSGVKGAIRGKSIGKWIKQAGNKGVTNISNNDVFVEKNQ